MITAETFSQMALSFAGTEEVTHFDRVGFKVRGKRMFASYLDKDNTANVFLTPGEQAVFCQMATVGIYQKLKPGCRSKLFIGTKQRK